MLRKALCAIMLACSLALPITAEEAPQESAAPALVSSAGNKVDGLELPANMTVAFDEGFVRLDAKTDGEVKWLVLAGFKVKYIQIPAANAIIVSVPPQGGKISVFGIAVVKGKQTEFARTDITVTVAPKPEPTPDPNAIATGKLHITVVIDPDKVTPAQAQLLNSSTLRQAISDKGFVFRIYNADAKVLVERKLDSFVKKVGVPALIIQADDGTVVYDKVLPKAENDFMAVIKQLTGDK